MAETKDKTMFEDLYALHKEIDGVEFTKEATGSVGQGRTYKYQDLPSLRKVDGPLLRKHNFVWYTQPSISPSGEPTLKYTLLHKSGGEISGEMLLMLKSADPQGQGSAITYARRYARQNVLDVVSEEDDDGAKATAAAQAAGKTKEDVAKPITELTKQNIYRLVKALNMDVEELQKSIGMQVDSLSEKDGNDLVKKLMTELEKRTVTK